MSQRSKQLNQSLNQPLVQARSESGTLLPNDHLKLLVDLLRPGSVELSRRLVSALMLVPENERESIVDAIESQIVADYT
tara:strand:- start:13 stop:249 length:237 start_codon:yes stop_codon:yes gene_type:complete